MSPFEIKKKFGPRLVGSKRMKFQVCKVLSQMPEKIIEFITNNCWFMASMEDAYAFTFIGNDLAENHLIFLSDELLSEDEEQIHYTIAHEIGHVILGHRNSVIVKQSTAEIKKQEKEADQFAKSYLF